MQLKDKSLFKQECLVGGKWIKSADGDTLEVTNPADGSVLGVVPKLGRKETAQAVKAAEEAFPAWKALLPLQRAAVLRRWNELIMENIDDLSMIMTLEQGKPLAEARGEINNGSGYILWFAEEGRRACGEVIPSPWAGKQPMTIRQPIGVTAAITPWNFPMSMIARKAAPALAAGCPMVIKPASATPYTALAMGELAMRAGVPAGILSVVTGSASEIGDELCSNAAVRKLSFTGSTAVGKKLIEGCSRNVKKVSMELGGNAPMIICEDADMDLAVTGAMGCKFRNSGQTCICVNRFIVHESIVDEFVVRLTEQARKIIVGPGVRQGVTQGPMIDARAHRSMSEFVDDARARGAKVVLGGKGDAQGGLFFEPTIITGMTKDMRIFTEEVFGPIASIMSFRTENEAVSLANDTEYGLASYVFTRNLKSFYRLAVNLEYGMVGVNEVALASGEVPFGGVKESGLGREGGRQGIDEYMETKYILLGGLQ
jgi:succinate-semialdehyde dehydrogenase/glutarate-semialdehyde dehydrogenase